MLGEIKIILVTTVELCYHHLLRRNTHRHSPRRLAEMVISHFWRYLCFYGLCLTSLALHCRGRRHCPDASSSNLVKLGILPLQPATVVFCSVKMNLRPVSKHSNSNSATS